MWQRITIIIQAVALALEFVSMHLPSVVFKQFTSYLMKFFCPKTSHHPSDVGRETYQSINEVTSAGFKRKGGGCIFFFFFVIKENETVSMMLMLSVQKDAEKEVTGSLQDEYAK